MLEVVHRSEGILHDLGDVGLHLGSRGARIGGHDRDIRRIHLREHIHRQFHEAVNTDHDNRHEDQGGRYRFLYRCFVNCHSLLAITRTTALCACMVLRDALALKSANSRFAPWFTALG